MIFKLTNSNFSESNIGTLNSWRIIKSLQGVSTSSNIVSVAKDGSYSAVFTVLDGYTFNTASVTMGGTDLTSSLVWDANNKTANLSISKVTNNVYISISANRDSEEGEEVVRQRTIVYKYLTLSGQTIQASTYEKVDDGTFKTFDINNAPEIEGYEKIEVTPASATVTGNITVIYTYKSTQEEENIPVTGVTLDRATYTLEIEDSIQLYHTVVPSDASDTRVRWSTSNGCCTVVNGLVTAVRAGNCTITVTTVNGSFTDTCAITVNAASGGGEEEPDTPPVDPNPDVPVDPNSATWYIEPTAISAFNSASKPQYASFVYPINNALIGVPINAIRLTVNTAGTLSYGKVSASEYTKLGTVTLENPSKDLQIYMLEETFMLGEEESIWFQAADDTGLFYYHSSAGNTVGNFKASVKAPTKITSGTPENLSIDVGFVGALDDIEVTGISISNPISSLLEGSTHQLIAKAIPSYVKLPQVKWTASNGNCTVDNNGLVTAVEAGDCIITVKTLDGSFTDTCTITVYDLANSPTTWYVDGMAGLSGNTSRSTNTTASFAYKDEAINNAYRGRPINALRMSVAQAGTFTYGKAGASAKDLYEVLGTIEFTADDVCASCTEVQIFTIPTITLGATESLWVQARSTDTGLFYYGAGGSSVPGYTGFRVGIHPSVATETSTAVILGIDIGFINPNEDIPVDNVLINPSTANVSVGETIQLTCTVSPKIATNKTVVWTSSDNVNCPVDNNGSVTVNAMGLYTITASATDGSGVKGECTINADDTTWYLDTAIGSGTMSASDTSGGFAYANADEIATYIGVPINRIKLAVQKAGTFTYGKTDGTTRTILGTLDLVNPSQSVQIYQLNETITLTEGENLWFSESTDTGRFYYKTSSATGNFYNKVKDDSPSGQSRYSHNLAISIGYKA